MAEENNSNDECRHETIYHKEVYDDTGYFCGYMLICCKCGKELSYDAY